MDEKRSSSEGCSTTDINSDSDLELPVLSVPSRNGANSIASSAVATSCHLGNISPPSNECNPRLSCSSSTEINSDSDLELLDVEESKTAELPMKKKSQCTSSAYDDDCIVVQMDLSHAVRSSNVRNLPAKNDMVKNVHASSPPPLMERIRLQLSNAATSSNVSDECDELPEVRIPQLSSALTCEGSTESVNVLKGSSDSNDTQVESKQKGRKKRSPAEIAESKRLAEERKAQRQRQQEEKHAEKEREMQLRKAAQENKKHYRPGECLKYITVSVDPGVVNHEGLGASLFKTCADAGIHCVTEPQTVPNTVTWKREILDCSAVLQQNKQQPKKVDVVEDEVLAMIHLPEFISLVQAYISSQCGRGTGAGLTLREHVLSVQSALSQRTVTFFVLGLESYFSDKARTGKQRHREAMLAVSGHQGPSKAKQAKRQNLEQTVSRTEIEEALVDTQLHTDCVVHMLNSNQEVADLVHTFTKAVAEKPAKKDRLDGAFRFLEEGVAGVKVDKAGQGLLKVWKTQLLQFKSLGPDMAEAIVGAYPSPRLLIEAYKTCSTEREAERLLENIMVRRGAGVLATNRRIGKELSRRIQSFFTSLEPDFLLK